jgi:hypothetical protein
VTRNATVRSFIAVSSQRLLYAVDRGTCRGAEHVLRGPWLPVTAPRSRRLHFELLCGVACLGEPHNGFTGLFSSSSLLYKAQGVLSGISTGDVTALTCGVS